MSARHCQHRSKSGGIGLAHPNDIITITIVVRLQILHAGLSCGQGVATRHPFRPPIALWPVFPDDGDRLKEFTTMFSAVPHHLNDVVMAPLQLKRLPRGVAKHSLAPGGNVHVRAGGAGVLLKAQCPMMEVERENPIRWYREMKELFVARCVWCYSTRVAGSAGPAILADSSSMSSC
ncbi:hypothetical protein BC827DRAFT_1153915 [Russula dissimulans]|nr:hypothetical protein BC827DRAFT_1153915 [Russula dissimulans]